jgi:hypothetical protein
VVSVQTYTVGVATDGRAITVMPVWRVYRPRVGALNTAGAKAATDGRAITVMPDRRVEQPAAGAVYC